jgi:outer membrane protein assembly factor BamB
MLRAMRRLVLSVVLLALGASAAAAPDGFDPSDQRRLFGVRDTRAARDAIEEMNTALSHGQVLHGLETAQRVLDEMPNDFYLEEKLSRPESVLWRSAAEVVRERLAHLTPEEHAAYEKLSAPSAVPLLQRAARQRDTSALREALRRFGASTAGLEAARTLAEIEVEAGQWRDAARTLREGLRYAPHDAGLWARLVDALAGAGDRRALAALHPPADLSYGHGDAARPIAALRDEALAAVPQKRGSADWPMWGGVPARDAQHPQATPMPTRLRWTETTDWMERNSDEDSPYFPSQRSATTRRYEEMVANFRPLHPVAAGHVIYVSDGRSVRAYDTTSARELWVFDARSAPELQLVRPRMLMMGRTSLDRVYSPVVSGDLVVATVEVAQPYRPDHLQGIEISTYMPRRILVGLDRATGRPRWWMGRSGVDSLSLSHITIIGPPVVAEGLVLALGAFHDTNYNVSFLAFDVHTGALRWRRPLGFGQQELNLFGAPLKELAASPVAVADGVAYASTGLGFVAAVDIRTGVPRWLASYEIIPVEKVELWYDTPLRIPQVAASPPVVHGDLVVVAPPDAGHIQAYDRRTGQLRWRKPFVPAVYDSTNHFLGVAYDGHREVVLLTDRELRARDLKTGRTVWRGRFDPEGDRVLGAGAVAGDEVLVPTEAGLQRFALHGDGAYRGTVPWPEGAEPGNLLPLERVLVVSSRDTLQWFYDWAAIERDVARRRKENPDDPTILLEAGDMYLRGGGEIDRARKAFEEAREVAHRSRPELEGRAVRGLYDTWLRAGDLRAGAFTDQAVADYHKALGYARTPGERATVRVRIHRALADATDPRERIRNLEAMARESGDAVVVWEKAGGEVPARAAALFALAREQLAREHPTEAVDALQRILHADRDARFPDGPAGDRARREIADILKKAGTLPYRRYEEKARALLAKARKSGDESLLDRILAEYPNAQVVTDARLERARNLLAAGRPAEATRSLQHLLADAPAEHPLVPTALAALAVAYRQQGARGAAGAALARLEARYAQSPVRWDGAVQDGATFAAAERKRLTAPPAAPPKGVPLSTPLQEVHFERAGDEQYATQVEVATESVDGAPPAPPPLALMRRGDELVGLDLVHGRVAWTARTGPVRRAACADGVLVLALDGEMRGLQAATGKQVWSVEMPEMAMDLQVSQGLAVAHLRDLSRGGDGGQRLVALDVFQGSRIWSTPLAQQDYRFLQATDGHVLLHEVHADVRPRRTRLLVFDLFDGARSHVVDVPFGVEGVPLHAGSLEVVAGVTRNRERHIVAAFDLAHGRLAWLRPLEGSEAVCCLARDRTHVLVLRSDGTLLTHALAGGALLAQTRIFVANRGGARPFPGTSLLVGDGRVIMIPWARRPAFGTVCYDQKTGKLAWESSYNERFGPSKATLVRDGDVVCTMVSYPRDNAQRILVRLIDAHTGRMLQEIEPEGLSRERWIPSMVEAYGTLVVFGKAGASIFRPTGK